MNFWNRVRVTGSCYESLSHIKRRLWKERCWFLYGREVLLVTPRNIAAATAYSTSAVTASADLS